MNLRDLIKNRQKEKRVLAGIENRNIFYISLAIKNNKPLMGEICNKKMILFSKGKKIRYLLKISNKTSKGLEFICHVILPNQIICIVRLYNDLKNLKEKLHYIDEEIKFFINKTERHFKKAIWSRKYSVCELETESKYYIAKKYIKDIPSMLEGCRLKLNIPKGPVK